MPWTRHPGVAISIARDGQLLVSAEASAPFEVSSDVFELLRLCDGTLTTEQISARVEWGGASVEARTVAIGHTLRRLERRGLVFDGPVPEGIGPTGAYLERYEAASVHRVLVGDSARTEAFEKAIAESVAPGDTVVEVGSGTGILAMMAARAGAKVVHAIEPTRLIEVARTMAAANGLDQIVFHRGDAADLELDVQADVVIGDWVGHFVVDERIFPAVAHQRDRCLRSGGRMLPERVDLFLAPVCEPELRVDGPELWSTRPQGFDLSAMRDLEYRQLRHEARHIEPDALIAEPRRLRRFDCASMRPGDLRGFVCDEVVFDVSRDGTLDGFCGYFAVELSPGVTLDTGPSSPATFYQQRFFRARPTPVSAGDRVSVVVHVGPELAAPSIAFDGAIEGQGGSTPLSLRYEKR